MEKFHMFDDRIYQMTNKIKAADRIIYTVMLNEQNTITIKVNTIHRPMLILVSMQESQEHQLLHV